MAGHVRTVELLVVMVLGTVLGVNAGGKRRDPPDIGGAMLSYLCRGTNSRICSGNGVCRSGRCYCETGYSGETCAVSDLPPPTDSTTTTPATEVGVTARPASNRTACSMEEASPCSGRGVCELGQCRCEPQSSGFRCETTMTEGFCKAYLACAECMALMTQCPEDCKARANFYLVFGFKTLLPSQHTCRQRNAAHNCVFYYRLAKEDEFGFKDIQVMACLPSQETTTTGSQSGSQDRKFGGPGSGTSGRVNDALAVTVVFLLLSKFHV